MLSVQCHAKLVQYCKEFPTAQVFLMSLKEWDRLNVWNKSSDCRNLQEGFIERRQLSLIETDFLLRKLVYLNEEMKEKICFK